MTAPNAAISVRQISKAPVVGTDRGYRSRPPLRDQRRRGEARDLLAPIYHWFTEGLDTPDLEAAKARLPALTPSRPNPYPYVAKEERKKPGNTDVSIASARPICSPTGCFTGSHTKVW